MEVESSVQSVEWTSFNQTSAYSELQIFFSWSNLVDGHLTAIFMFCGQDLWLTVDSSLNKLWFNIQPWQLTVLF